MSILEIVIPTVLFMALVALRAEGESLSLLRNDETAWSLYEGGETFNPVFKNESNYPKEIYPYYFCNAMAATVSDGK